MTNFEKIKAMSITELAEFLDKSANQEREDWEPIGCYCCADYQTHHYPKDCGECEWLKGIEAWLSLTVRS
jgi:hypothetical protein